MIRAVCPESVSDLKTGFVTGWNITPNVQYTISVYPGATSVAVWLFDAVSGAYVAGGAALVGTDQPVTLLSAASPGLGMVDADLGYHLLITSDGAEPAQTFSIGPFVDSADHVSAMYIVDDIAVAQASAVIREGTHYTDDVSILCPLGMDDWLGDACSATVHGESIVGDIESVSFQAGPSSMADVITVRRMSAILPDAPVVIVPPVVADDTAETDAATPTSGNVLTNDASGLTVVAVGGLMSNVGIAVAGSAGGEFAIAADGAWTFDPDGDFAALSGPDTAETSVTYHASNGQAEVMATLTVTVGAVATSGDPLWADVVMLVQAPESGATIADATGKSVAVNGGAVVNTALGYPSIYLDGSGDSFFVGASGDFNLLHNGASWTIDFIFRPARGLTDNVIIDTTRGTSSNSGIYLSFAGSNKLQLFVSRGSYSTFVIGSTTVSERTFDYIFALDEEVHIAIDLDLSREVNHARLYVNGSHVASLQKKSYTPSTYNSAQLLVGMFSTSFPVYAYQGHIRVIRITAGLRDVSTPPSWPYPTE